MGSSLHVEPNFGGCYTGGIDAHGAQGWEVRHKRFEGIYCAGEGLAEHAVHFWKGARGTLVENNIIVNCAREIGFGIGENDEGRTYPDKSPPGYVGHFGGLIRNNVVYADMPYFDTGIELSQARGTKVFHNTIPLDPAVTSYFSPIDFRFANTSVTIRNNLVEAITARDGARGAPGRANAHARTRMARARAVTADPTSRAPALTGAGCRVCGSV